VRLFIAIEIDTSVRQRAAAIAESARRALDRALDVSWIRPENLHITLLFLGETPAPRAQALRDVVARPFATTSFDMRISGFGAFPSSGLPRVLWLGVEQGAAAIAQVHAELALRLRPLGIEPERRPFSAHLTLGRVKAVRAGVRPRDVRDAWRALEADAGNCRVEAVTLFRSTLSPKGAVYDPLLRVPLQ
jgi:2'-5' RNA ligase